MPPKNYEIVASRTYNVKRHLPHGKANLFDHLGFPVVEKLDQSVQIYDHT